jgi:cytochrome c oxidase subunit 2
LGRSFWLPALGALGLTVLGEAVALGFDPFPPVAAEEARVADGAFRILTALAVPVFAFVLSFLVYSALRFRRRAGEWADGPPVHGSRPVAVTWLGVTTTLTLVLIAVGTLGLEEIRHTAHLPPDLVVRVEGMRWGWQVSYPEAGVSTNRELVLPVGRRVRVEVTSRDVVHSFWIPAFRAKIDAVPGMVTSVAFTPNRTGGYQEDPDLRVQCAELCGTGHTLMVIPVRIVTDEEFRQWLANQSRQM